jgi:uridylate kinase
MGGEAAYRRVLLKVSGEAFCAPGGSGIEPAALEALVGELAGAREMGVQLAIVTGGGNFFRGRALAKDSGIERPTADAMGMLATVMNALALADVLESGGIPARATSAVAMGDMCEPFDRRRVIEHLEAGRIVLLGGGTGQPFFTTDTCAALRACQIGADALFKATKVEGVFEADPVTHPRAAKFDRLSYGEVLSRQLGVIDLAAVSLCMKSRIPVVVFKLDTPGNLAAAMRGEPVGTLVCAE